MKNIFKKTEGEQRRTRLGSFSLIGIAVAIIAVIVVNLLVSSLPSRLTKFDMSAEDLYTLSEDTEKLVADVDADITMYQLLGSSSSTYGDMIWEQICVDKLAHKGRAGGYHAQPDLLSVLHR